MQLPGRVVGMHFFNPVPLMRLVEVVSGLATEPAVADAIHMLAADWGKTAVHAKSTPGFIVNRIARPFYAETLALLQEQAATPAVLDACVRGAGFRMGPCELMDLIGHDTNFAVTQSVYEANFFDKRYQPSLVQREMVDGGLLGRKSGRGFYRYPEGGGKTERRRGRGFRRCRRVPLVLHGGGAIADLLAARLAASGLGFTREAADAGAETRLHDRRRPADAAPTAAAPRSARRRWAWPTSRCSTGRSARRRRERRRPSWRSPGRRRRRHRPNSRRAPPRCCARSAGCRSAWPTCRAWWWRARSRCWSTRPATRWSRACATPPAPMPR